MRQVAAPPFVGQSRSLVVLALVASGLSACRTAPEAPAFDPASAASSIRRSLPAGWVADETRSNEIPFGHYWGDWSGPYQGQRGTLLVVTGPKPVSVWWSDNDGRSHRDPVAVESLDVWLMPSAYRNNWRTLLSMHAPLQPDRIFADERVRVYARPSSRLTIPEHQFKEQIMAKATEISWPESPGNKPARLSWGSWQADLRRALAREGQSPTASHQGTRELLEIGASLSGYSLLWPSERCCAFTLEVKPDGRATAQVNVSKGPRPSERRLAFSVSTEQRLRVQEVLDEARFFDLPKSVGVVAIDGDVRKLRIRRGSQSHEVELGGAPGDAAAGTLEMRRAETVWQTVRSLIRIDEATDR